MPRLVCALAVVLAVAPQAAAERMITDSAGRQVAVPDRVERVSLPGRPRRCCLKSWPRTA